jgi:hypothetical protein
VDVRAGARRPSAGRAPRDVRVAQPRPASDDDPARSFGDASGVEARGPAATDGHPDLGRGPRGAQLRSRAGADRVARRRRPRHRYTCRHRFRHRLPHRLPLRSRWRRRRRPRRRRPRPSQSHLGRWRYHSLHRPRRRSTSR